MLCFEPKKNSRHQGSTSRPRAQHTDIYCSRVWRPLGYPGAPINYNIKFQFQMYICFISNGAFPSIQGPMLKNYFCHIFWHQKVLFWFAFYAMIKLYFEHKSELLITLFNFVSTEISFLLFLEILPDDYGYCLDQSTIHIFNHLKSCIKI